MGQSIHLFILGCLRLESSHQDGFTHIGIDDQHALAGFGQRTRKIHRHGTFSLVRDGACEHDNLHVIPTELYIRTQSTKGFLHCVAEFG